MPLRPDATSKKCMPMLGGCEFGSQLHPWIISLKVFWLSTLLLLYITACGTSSTQVEGTVTSTLAPLITSTLPPIGTASPSITPAPPSPTPTEIPIEGTVVTQINVRTGPGTNHSSIGALQKNEKVQIVGKDQNSQWYAIIYPAGPEGRGWVLGTYIKVDDAEGIPEIALETKTTPANNTGKVIQKLNVRSGPGTNYDILGTIQPQTTVTLTGKNESGTWLQIEFAAGPGGKGWVTAIYVQVSNTSELPIMSDTGSIATDAGTPGPIPATAVATFAPAWQDGDSPTAPATSITLSPEVSRSFSYSSGLSIPQGDREDWIAVTVDAYRGESALVITSLACNGNADVSVELWQAETLQTNLTDFVCNRSNYPIRLNSGLSYQLHLQAIADGNTLQYVFYTLTIQLP